MRYAKLYAVALSFIEVQLTKPDSLVYRLHIHIHKHSIYTYTHMYVHTQYKFHLLYTRYSYEVTDPYGCSVLYRVPLEIRNNNRKFDNQIKDWILSSREGK